MARRIMIRRLTFAGAFVGLLVGDLVGDLTGVIGIHPQLRFTGVYVAQLPPFVTSIPGLQDVWPPLPLDKTTDAWAASFSPRLFHRGVELQHFGTKGETKVAVLTQPAGIVVFL